MSLSPLTHLLLATMATALLMILLHRTAGSRDLSEKSRLATGSRLWLTLLFPVFIADLFCLVLKAWYTYTPNHNPLYYWLLNNLAGTLWFKPLVLMQDMLQHVVLAIPFAWLLLQVKPRWLLIKSIVFMVSLLLFSSWPVIVSGKIWAEWERFLLPLLVMLPMLPIALYLLARRSPP